MHEIDLNISVKKAFGNLYRKRCVLINVEDNQENILLGAKPGFYPPSITRLLGGGVYEGESTQAAAIRELSEELHIEVNPADLTLIVQFNISAVDSEGKRFLNQTFVYHTKVSNEQYRAGDDVKYIDKLSIDELSQLGERYKTLSDTLWYIGPEGEFSWADYGKVYGPVHEITANNLKALRQK